MSQVTEILEEETVLQGKATLVRRVSDMFKDGNYSGPPLLFRHASMQKLRHCCQNLNLFPYLLYSYDNSKSHPLAQRVNVCISDVVRSIVERFFFLYKSVRLIILQHGLSREKSLLQAITSKKEKKTKKKEQNQAVVQRENDVKVLDSKKRFPKYQCRQQRKRISFLLTVAIYLAPIILAFQLIALCSILIFDKYTPGFVFLVSSLLFLGCIALKIVFHETVKLTTKCEKRKVE